MQNQEGLTMRSTLATLLSCILVTVSQAQDSEGCSDHPLVGRMPGFYITSCSNSEDSSRVVVGTVDGQYQRKVLFGNVTMIDYCVLDPDAKKPSWLQTVNNYKDAMKKIGARTIVADAHCASFRLTQREQVVWIVIEPTGADSDGANLTTYFIKVIEVQTLIQ
jgi:hypothetical protein